MSRLEVCLAIGGSDSCGGAGIQADLRVFADLGALGCSAITALTAQNHREISRIEAVSLAQLDAELHAIFDAYDVKAVKTGMLLDVEHMAVISACLGLYHVGQPLVVDPVMVSSSGRELLAPASVEALKHTLMRQATLLTPNLDEAAVLLSRSVGDAVEDAAALSLQMGCSVLLKGGHGAGRLYQDVLSERTGDISVFSHAKQQWSAYAAHGTGCRLASAIAAYLAQGECLHDACEKAVAYVQGR